MQPITRRDRWLGPRLGLVPGLMLALALAVLPAYAAPTETPTVSTGLAFTIGDPRITESSGLARDTDNNVFWTVNESDPAGVVYAIGPDGRTRGTVEFSAAPLDVEAVAYAGGRLYIADIGDDGAQRQSIAIHVIAQPVPGVDRGSDFTTYEFTYPDGPRDAEGILVNERGQIVIITHAAQGAVYRAPRQVRTGAPNQLTRVADAPAWITDATVLSTGQYALRTYLSVEILEPELYAPVARNALPYQPRGESVTMSLTDNALLIGSAGAQSRVLRVPIPTALEPVETAGPTPPPSPLPSAQASVTLETPTVGVNRTGTLVALGLALLVAIAAGLVVYLRGRDSEAPVAAAARHRWEENEAANAEAPAQVPFPDSPESSEPGPGDPRQTRLWSPDERRADGTPPDDESGD